MGKNGAGQPLDTRKRLELRLGEKMHSVLEDWCWTLGVTKQALVSMAVAHFVATLAGSFAGRAYKRATLISEAEKLFAEAAGKSRQS